jgi:hypothetical protein
VYTSEISLGFRKLRIVIGFTVQGFETNDDHVNDAVREWFLEDRSRNKVFQRLALWRGGNQNNLTTAVQLIRNVLTVVKIQKNKRPVVKSRGLCKRDSKPAKTAAR